MVSQKLLTGGNLTLSYKGFDIEAFVQGQAGNKILFGMVRTDRPVSNKLKVFFDDRWTPTHTEATMPKAGTISDSWHSDLLVFSGNYMKVKQLQLGYTLPKSLLNKVKATKARFYVSLENGITFRNILVWIRKWEANFPTVSESTVVCSQSVRTFCLVLQ